MLTPELPCAEFSSERESPIVGLNDKIEKNWDPKSWEDGGKKIVKGGDHGEEFQRGFLLHIISSCIFRDRWSPTAMHWTTDAAEQRYKAEKDSLESMEVIRQLTGWTIRRLFIKVKLNYKRNRRTWDNKTKHIPNLLHQPMALHRPLNNVVRNVAVKESLQ
ncbi:hypothetical protein Cgig2_017506 [Carnegiea gigantea]|uniref:Uncharacterized protein n=1 Tax=Carnegiea gigantea TaxID=171969 RepID=A0A9Q1K435_9CARY|nr:hypothetical protein Cgig2_017506 [Carnegiea gigantea]